MSSTKRTTKDVLEGKGVLSGMLSSPGVESLTDADVERCQDMFKVLDGLEITLEILTETLIGTVVSKFKSHPEIGPTAKSLVKKWKAIAKKEGAVSSSSSSAAAAAARKKPPPSSSAPSTAASKPPPKKSMERRESAGSETGAAAAVQQEWSTLPSHRQTTCQKLHDFLSRTKKSLVEQGINESAIDHLLVERATEVEAAIQTKFPRQDQQSEYLAKARSLCFNVKKNTALATEIILGQLDATELVNMSVEQLASDEQKKKMEERTKTLFASKQLDWESQNEDKINKMCGITGDLLKASLFTCGRCKSTKTTSTQKQTRSADEPMTVFVLCLNCGKRWKFS
mmetsp:Transcript_62724/g.152707  ORF Transcript_62724/g.152707 Transcript_62724/m.152707 type:complete len:341 (-) Transcript_62724:1194-2216(-)